MRYIITILFVFTILAINTLAATSSIQHYSDLIKLSPGTVGCLMSTGISHPNDCPALSALLQSARVAYSEDDNRMIETTSAAIMQSTANYPYAAVLITAISGDKRFIPALQTLATREKQQALAFHYAEKALEVLSTGACTKPVNASTLHMNYMEICQFHDPFFMRLRLLKRK